MGSFLIEIREKLSRILGEPAEVTRSTQESFGHYQCNSCLKKGSNPRQVAESVLKQLEGDSFFSRVEIAGPGFLNMTLSDKVIAERVEAILTDPLLGADSAQKKERVIVEFSSPNVAKELHVGHLRSTIIGDALARIFEFLEYDVLRLNHIGDWGTQFGMLISFLEEEGIDGGEDLSSLMHWYKESKKKFDSDPEFKKLAQLRVVALQGGEPKALETWKKICEVSKKGFEEIYQFLDVTLVCRGESFYNNDLLGVVEDLEKKGLITVSQGAKCVFLDNIVGRDGSPLPMIVQKTDGGFNYETTDMAALKHRVEVEKADRIIILTDAGQALHFQMVFEAGKKAGYYDPSQVRLDHVPFGVVLGPDGKKFKTRSGETEKLIDLLKEATRRALVIVEERLPELSSEEKALIAHRLGVGAVKYADLSGNRVKDYLFSYEKMLRFEGNTAAFLLYAYVRTIGIGKKVEVGNEKIVLNHPSEIRLALHLCQFSEVLSSIVQDLLPNHLTDYLYLLAEKFNGFYRDCRVEGSPEEKSRIRLVQATGKILKKGLELLGLNTVDQM